MSYTIAELFAIATSLLGLAYIAGVQYQMLRATRKDVGEIASMYRALGKSVSEIQLAIAELKKDVEYLKEN